MISESERALLATLLHDAGLERLVEKIDYRKGPYFAEDGDFASAGSAHIKYRDNLDHGILDLTAGGEGYRRLVLAGSTPLTEMDAKSMLRGPLKPPLAAPAPGTRCVELDVCFGTVPETFVRLSVSPPTALATSACFATAAILDDGNVSSVLWKLVRVNFWPAFRLPKPTWPGPASLRSCARSAGVRV